MKGGSEGVGINSNFGDTAVLSNIKTNGKPTSTNVCCTYKGVASGSEPSKIGWYVLHFHDIGIPNTSFTAVRAIALVKSLDLLDRVKNALLSETSSISVSL
jgi:hypothetical protein